MRNKALAALVVTLLSLVGLQTPAFASQTVKGAEPTITGDVVGGGSVAIATGKWSPGVKFSYKWLLDGVGIRKATAKNFRIPAGYLGHALSVSVTGSKAGMKSLTRSSSSYQVGQILLDHEPSLTGDLFPTGTLSLEDFVSMPEQVDTTYSWYRNGVQIPGADISTLVLSSSDIGAFFTLKLVLSAPGCDDFEYTTPSIGPVLQKIQVYNPPTIRYSSLAAGALMTVSPGSYSASQLTFSYQWFANGQAIAGANSSSYQTTSSQGGMLISVAEIVSAPGYAILTQNSASVGPLLTTRTWTSTHMDGYKFYLNCGGIGYRTCSQDSFAVSQNLNGIRIYAGTSYSDSATAMFGLRIPEIDPSNLIRWRITTKGYSGVGVDRPGILASTSSSWMDTVVPSMSLLSNDGLATTPWLTTPMGGSDGHSLFWGIFQRDWGNYYVDYFVVEVEYLG